MTEQAWCSFDGKICKAVDRCRTINARARCSGRDGYLAGTVSMAVEVTLGSILACKKRREGSDPCGHLGYAPPGIPAHCVLELMRIGRLLQEPPELLSGCSQSSLARIDYL